MNLAFLFPGQGSQSVAMLDELAGSFELVRNTFAEASDALGYDLWKIVSAGPVESLNQTQVTQPAMLAAGVAVWRAWQQEGGADPQFMAGHSLGEYTALVCAEAMDYLDAVSLVAERGRLMQEAVPAGSGAMAAILGLEDTAVQSICAEAAEGQVVEAVNFNSPGQVVIAGEGPAVERAMMLAKDAGAKRALLLPVSVPSHCALMQPAAEKLAGRLSEIAIRSPRIPVVHNVDVQTHEDPDGIRNALTMQLYRPVRWVETIRALAARNVDRVIECGPGKVLTGLNKRIEKAISAEAVYDTATLRQALSSGREE